MDSERPVLRLDNQICFAVYATAHAFNRTYKPLLEPLGLTYPQYLVMMVLWERDQLLVKDIGERLELDSGTLSPLLKRLEKAGLVERHRNHTDEREVYVRLTEKGQQLENDAQNIMPEILQQTACGVEELSVLRVQLNMLRKSLLNKRDTA